MVRVYVPPDANTSLYVAGHGFRSRHPLGNLLDADPPTAAYYVGLKVFDAKSVPVSRHCAVGMWRGPAL